MLCLQKSRATYTTKGALYPRHVLSVGLVSVSVFRLPLLCHWHVFVFLAPQLVGTHFQRQYVCQSGVNFDPSDSGGSACSPLIARCGTQGALITTSGQRGGWEVGGGGGGGREREVRKGGVLTRWEGRVWEEKDDGK